MKLTSQKWVILGKPSTDKAAEELGVPVERLRQWMDHPLWASSVLYAEHEVAHREKIMECSRTGERIPRVLLDQAVVLRLAGWTLKDIGKVVNRQARTIRYWESTAAWQEVMEGALLDKLRMHLIDESLAIRKLISDAVDLYFGSGDKVEWDEDFWPV